MMTMVYECVHLIREVLQQRSRLQITRPTYAEAIDEKSSIRKPPTATWLTLSNLFHVLLRTTERFRFFLTATLAMKSFIYMASIRQTWKSL